jgi:cytochrome c5
MRAADGVLCLLLVSACAPAGGGEAAPAPAQAASLETAVQDHERQAIEQLPPGDGRTAVLSSCMICHGVGMIAQQHKDAAGWQRTIRQMITWGAPVQPGQEEVINAYLTEHFGPASPR